MGLWGNSEAINPKILTKVGLDLNSKGGTPPPWRKSVSLRIITLNALFVGKYQIRPNRNMYLALMHSNPGTLSQYWSTGKMY